MQFAREDRRDVFDDHVDRIRSGVAGRVGNKDDDGARVGKRDRWIVVVVNVLRGKAAFACGNACDLRARAVAPIDVDAMYVANVETFEQAIEAKQLAFVNRRGWQPETFFVVFGSDRDEQVAGVDGGPGSASDSRRFRSAELGRVAGRVCRRSGNGFAGDGCGIQWNRKRTVCRDDGFTQVAAAFRIATGIGVDVKRVRSAGSIDGPDDVGCCARLRLR